MYSALVLVVEMTLLRRLAHSTALVSATAPLWAGLVSDLFTSYLTTTYLCEDHLYPLPRPELCTIRPAWQRSWWQAVSQVLDFVVVIDFDRPPATAVSDIHNVVVAVVIAISTVGRLI